MKIAEINGDIIANIEKFYRSRMDEIKALDERFKLNKDYIPVYQRKLEIDGTEQGDLVNHPVHVDFLGNIVNTKIGYLFGNEIDIKSGEKSNQGTIDDFIKRVYFQDVIAEIGTMAAVGGYAAVLLYVNEDGDADVMSIPPQSCLFIGDDILKPQIAIRFYNSEVIEKDKVVIYRYAEVYDKANYTKYRANKKPIADSVNKNEQNHSLFWVLHEEAQPHGFTDIPLIAFKNNDNLKGDCENVLDEMDAYDRVLSDELSDVEQYRLDYLVIKGDMGKDPEEAAQKLKKMRIMYLKSSSDGQNNLDAYFITRMMELDKVNDTLDRIKKEIYEIARHLNVSDKNFGNASSGVALRNKQLPFEFKCLETEREFRASLTKMFKMLSEFWSLKSNNVNYLDIDYIFTRNYANNKLEEADIYQKLYQSGLPPEVIIPLTALDIDVEEMNTLLEEKNDKEVERLKTELEKQDEEEEIVDENRNV